MKDRDTVGGQEPLPALPRRDRGEAEGVGLRGPVFSGPPRGTEVEQNTLGDCFLLAPLASLAERRPEQVHAAIQARGGGKFAVRLFQKDEATGALAPHEVVVDPRIPEELLEQLRRHPVRPHPGLPGHPQAVAVDCEPPALHQALGGAAAGGRPCVDRRARRRAASRSTPSSSRSPSMMRSRRRVSGSSASRSISVASRREGGGRVPRRVRGVLVALGPPAAGRQGAERRAAEAEVVDPAPVTQVVACLGARARVVRDLVVRRSPPPRAPPRRRRRRRRRPRRRRGAACHGRAISPNAVPGSIVRLYAETWVTPVRATRAASSAASAGVIVPPGSDVGGDAVDEVRAHPLDPRAERREHGFEPALGAVEAAEEREASGVEALHADAEPAHPHVAELPRPRFVERGRVALHGHLHRRARGPARRRGWRRARGRARPAPRARACPRRRRPSRAAFLRAPGRRRSSSASTASA